MSLRLARSYRVSGSSSPVSNSTLRRTTLPLTLKASQPLSPKRYSSVLVTEADSFIGPGAAPDDMTVVVLRRLSEA